MGSPPQVRGKLFVTPFLLAVSRITPAGAGKTMCNHIFFCTTRDHPRRCGENLSQSNSGIGESGSPPQVRGKLFQNAGVAKKTWITPAGAGKTVKVGRPEIRDQDHPRRCGENISRCIFSCTMLGSPPQVRGKRLPTCSRYVLLGITPAGAGKTLKRSFRNQPFCSRAVQISFNFSNSLNVSLQSGSAR